MADTSKSCHTELSIVYVRSRANTDLICTLLFNKLRLLRVHILCLEEWMKLLPCAVDFSVVVTIKS
ncbi:unnamed protein product [Brugia pahangi]|uniref:Ovule protein n=1 Tax=Brugia pahangi TaxID=6280 RepID=A0A0N4TIE9_BRUPA|nr:unnamed protein product [Brugia pahangi]